MTQRIIFTNADSSVSVIVPAPGVDIADCVKNVPLGLAFEIVDEAEIPTDREFRNAWKRNGKAVEVDMPKAIEIKKDKLRGERAPLLAALDAEFMKALEAGNTAETTRIAAEKQVLRDITKVQELVGATTVEELKAVKIKGK